MSYHSLTQDSGGDADSRRAEATRLMDMLNNVGDEQLTVNQRNFLEDMFDDPNQPISTKQLFWLRDIKEKVLG